MSRCGKKLLVAGAALLIVAITASVVFTGSVLADKSGVGEDTEVFALSIGNGPAQIGYVESNGDCDAWGPWSFTVLNNGNIAILDGANQRVLVVDASGQQVAAVAFQDLGLLRPVDLREWRGRLAISDGNSDPQRVVLVRLNSWEVEGEIEVPDALAELGGQLEDTTDGGLQLVVGARESHLLCGSTQGFDVSTIRKVQPARDLAGIGQVMIDGGDPSQGIGPSIGLTLANEKSKVLRSIAASGVTATHLKVVGSDKQGNLLVETGYWLPKGNDYEIKMYLEQLSPRSLDTQASVTLPRHDFYVSPDRWISVDRSGRVWCMLPTKGEVSFHILTPTADKPDVKSGSIARSLESASQAVACAFQSVFDKAFGSEAANADGGNTSQTRTAARNKALAYYNLNWYCNTEAYYRSCGTPGGGGLDGNSRPAFIPAGGYNRYYQWAPYAWGHFRTAADIYNGIFTAGHDAGDASGGYIDGEMCYTLTCCYGVDCSGFVQRVWGVGGDSIKHSVSKLIDPAEGHASLLTPDGYTGMLKMDACAHPGHILLFDAWAGDYDNFYVFESTTDGYDRVMRHVHNWTTMKADDPDWHKYRYNYWTGS